VGRDIGISQGMRHSRQVKGHKILKLIIILLLPDSPIIYSAVCDYARVSEISVPSITERNPEGLLRTTLINCSELVAPKPLIVLFDEVDVLVDEPMVSFLRQLRGGFATRGGWNISCIHRSVR
jgi:hypothetical protein